MQIVRRSASKPGSDVFLFGFHPKMKPETGSEAYELEVKASHMLLRRGMTQRDAESRGTTRDVAGCRAE